MKVSTGSMLPLRLYRDGETTQNNTCREHSDERQKRIIEAEERWEMNLLIPSWYLLTQLSLAVVKQLRGSCFKGSKGRKQPYSNTAAASSGVP